MTLKRRLFYSGIISIALIIFIIVMDFNFLSKIRVEAGKNKKALIIVKKTSNIMMLTNNYIFHQFDREKEQWYLEYDNIVTILNHPPQDYYKNLFQDMEMLKSYFEKFVIENIKIENDFKIDRLNDMLIERMGFHSEHILNKSFILIEQSELEISNLEKIRGAFIISLVFILLFYNFLTMATAFKRILIPLKPLVNGTKQIKDGDYSGRLQLDQLKRVPDEFLQFADVFNVMTEKINESFTKLNYEIQDRKKAQNKMQITLKEKEVLLKEINHRVKNNLQIILSLMGMQESRIQCENDRDIFEWCRQRISSMTFVHDMLYNSDDYSKIDLGDFINMFVRKILNSFLSSEFKFNLDVEGSPIFVDLPRAVPCALILNELIANSIKYVFLDSEKESINISLTKSNKGKIIFTYNDSGEVIPDDFNPDSNESLGLTIINGLVDQIGGTLKLFENKTEITF